MPWFKYLNCAHTHARCAVPKLTSDCPAAPVKVPDGMVIGALRQPLGPPPGVVDVHATCEKGIVNPPELRGVDESAVRVAVRGWLFWERACASMRTEFAGHVGSAGVTLVLATAVPLPTLAPGTLMFT